MADTVRFDGRVAVVTGAGRGIGKAHARLLAQRGAMVVVNDLGSATDGTGAQDATPAQEVANEIRRLGGKAVANVGNVCDAGGANSIIETAIGEFGRIDIVINNAGNWQYMPFEDYSEAALRRDLDVHVLGSWNVTRAAWPHLRRQGYGRVLNTISEGIFGMPNAAGYCTAKAAVVGMTHALAREGGPLGIQVNAVAPSAGTRMGALFGEERRNWRDRHQTPDMVAAGACWLVHEQCDANGVLLSCWSGHMGRIFVAETNGYWTEPQSFTIEAARDALGKATDISGAITGNAYFVPQDCGDATGHIYDLLGIPGSPQKDNLNASLGKHRT